MIFFFYYKPIPNNAEFAIWEKIYFAFIKNSTYLLNNICTSILTSDFASCFNYNWLTTFLISQSDDYAHHMKLQVTDF